MLLHALSRKKRTATRSAEEPERVTGADVADVVTEWTGIPVTKVTDDEEKRLRNLEKTLSTRIVGQDAAVSAVAKAVRRGRLGIKDPTRPIGTFLFIGPTGVGKTELSRVLSEELYGQKDALIRVNMSEYQESFSSSKIIGSPPGYVGYDEGGQLTEQVRKKPYSVVLFDEIEKAHPDIFNLLLQIMDDGCLTDAQGRRVDFRNTVVIMTSNLGAKSIFGRTPLGFSGSITEAEKDEQTGKHVEEELKNVFRPEFLNRLDDIILFRPLTREELRKITESLLAKSLERLRGAGIAVQADASAVEYLLEKGYNEAYGARPLRRAITKYVEDAVTEKLLAGDLAPGDSVRLYQADGILHVTKSEPAPA